MFDLLDSILAFSAILLGVSLLVTVIVQGLGGLFNLRGWALADGLTELFAQAKIGRSQARELAQKILTHPLISDSTLRNTRLTHWIQASAIRKEELLRLLSEAEELGLELPKEVKARIDRASEIVRAWFDGQMDRVSQTFAHRTRSVTITVSFFIAFALHIDASVLLERMFTDSETRAKLVASVSALDEHAGRILERPSEPAADGSPSGADVIKNATAELRSVSKTLTASNIDLLPRFGDTMAPARGEHRYFDYLEWSQDGAWRHFLGIVAAGALLSLGAPFWFNALRQLANLRTVLANKEAQERSESKNDG